MMVCWMRWRERCRGGRWLGVCRIRCGGRARGRRVCGRRFLGWLDGWGCRLVGRRRLGACGWTRSGSGYRRRSRTRRISCLGMGVDRALVLGCGGFR